MEGEVGGEEGKEAPNTVGNGGVDRSGEKREEHTNYGQREERGGEKTDEAVSNQMKMRVRQKETRKETIALHSLCSHIYIYIYTYPWVDMLHEHYIDSMWQTHTTRTKGQMSDRRSSFSLFVCCRFSVLLMTQSFQKLFSYNRMMNKTAINLQEKQRQPIIVGRNTLVCRTGCFCACGTWS